MIGEHDRERERERERGFKPRKENFKVKRNRKDLNYTWQTGEKKECQQKKARSEDK